MGRVKVGIWGIVPGAQGNSVILTDPEAGRILPIVIGMPEALAILLELRGENPARPLTHDLMLKTFESLGTDIEYIHINDLQDGTFYARIAVTGAAGPQAIDARPSDAIALALRANAPIYVDEAVMAEAAHAASTELDGQLQPQPTEDAEGTIPQQESDPPTEEEVDKFRAILRDAGMDEPTT